VNDVPKSTLSPLYPPIPTDAAPDIDNSPALAETETNDAAKAVKPIFF